MMNNTSTPTEIKRFSEVIPTSIPASFFYNHKADASQIKRDKVLFINNGEKYAIITSIQKCVTINEDPNGGFITDEGKRIRIFSDLSVQLDS